MIETRPTERKSPDDGPAQVDAAPRSVDDPVRPAVAVLAAVAWIIFVPVALLAQPAPDPLTAPSAMAELISLVFLLTIFGALAGLTMRRRWGLLATIGGGATIAAAAGYCYLTGHTGTWILVQFMAGVGLAVTGRLLDRAI